MRTGHALVGLKSFDRAIEEYLAAIDIDPGLKKAYYSIGITYYNARRYDEASRWLERYLEIAPRADDRERVEGLIRSLKEWES